MTKIIQIAATQDRDGDPRLYALYDDGRLFERVLDASREYTIWYQINEPDSIVKERKEQDKKMQEYAFKGGAMQGIMFAGKLRDLPDGVPFPSMGCLLDEKPAKTITLPEYVRIGNPLTGTALRLEKDGRYHRQNGLWSVGYRLINDVLCATDPRDELHGGGNAHAEHLDGLPITPISREKWVEDEGFEVEE
jgi:hypothetical protein